MPPRDAEPSTKPAKISSSNFLLSAVRKMLPRRVVTAFRVLFKRSRLDYSAPYESWAAAKRDAVGYDDPAIFATVRRSALAVKEGRSAYERDSLLHDTIGFRWPPLACLLHVALQKNASGGRPLHILDFGGSLGSVYFQHRVFFNGLPSLVWSIVEQPHFVFCGNAEFADERLRYFNTIADAAARAPIDCALFSSSLEYTEMPYELLAQIAALDCRYLILDRLHVHNGPDDVIRVQRVKPPLYGAKLALRFFAKEKLTAHLRSIGYQVIAALPSGLFCERKSE
jgi:putative methyltransferase (TIGR04325 family)